MFVWLRVQHFESSAVNNDFPWGNVLIQLKELNIILCNYVFCWVTDKKSTWILIYFQARQSIYTQKNCFIKSSIKTNEIKGREFLIRVRPKRVAFLICKSGWGSLWEKCLYEIFVITPKLYHPQFRSVSVALDNVFHRVSTAHKVL